MTKAKILIVEDDVVVANNLRDRLIRLGHSVSGIAASGQEALRQAAESHPDLALVDVTLRGEMDGVVIAEEMRTRFDIPVVYWTGGAGDGTSQRAKVTDAHNQLPEPRESRQLPSTLQMAVQAHTTEQKLWESEEKYRTLVENSLQGIVIVEGVPPHVVFANPRCAAITGYTLKELLSLSPEDARALIHPDDQARLLSLLADRLAGHPVPRGGEVRIVRPDRAVRWVEYRGCLIEHNGRPAVQATLIDITERKQAQELLQKARNGLESQVEQRTAELARANALLREQIATQLRIEKSRQRQDRELQMLNLVAQRLSSSLDLDHVVATVLDEARHLLDASGCTVWLLDPEAGSLTCWQASGPHSEILAGMRIPPGEGLVGWVAQHGEDLLVTDTRTDDRHFKKVDEQIGVEIRSILSVPLKGKEGLIGVLQVVGEKPGSFDETDLLLLKPLATSAAIAIDNARLYDEANQLRAFNESIVQSMQEGIFLEDNTGHITFANPATAELLGYTLDDLKGRHWGTIVDAEHRDQVELETAMRPQGISSRYETVLRTREGRRLPVIISARPMFDNGDFSGTLAVFMDISERKRAEESLQQRVKELALLNRVIAASAASQASEPILKTVCRELAVAFDASQTVAALFNEDRTEATIVAEYLGNGQASKLGTTVSVTEDASVQHLVQHQAPLVVADVETVPFLASTHDPTSPGGSPRRLIVPLVIDAEVVGSVGVSTMKPAPFSADEAELAQRVAEQVSGALARARLTETQQRLSAAVEQAAEAVIITGTDGTILYVNPAFEQTTGYGRTEAVGQNPRILKSGRHDDAFYSAMWNELSAGQMWQGRLINRKKDDSQFVADETIAPVRNQAGVVVNYVATMRDVTQVVELEEQFHHAQKMEALGRLAGGIAHDFGNLLHLIEMGAGVLKLQMSPRDPLRQHVEQIEKTGKRANSLTKQLLRFSRREAMEPQVLDLNQLLGDMSWMLQSLMSSDIELATAQAEEPALTRVDPSRMEQVIMNLALNARDAMPDGGTLTIETSNVVLAEPDDGLHPDVQAGNYVLLTVSDTGVGMHEDVKARLFEPFFTTKPRGEGTGLGLSTVFGIVKGSGGHIRVDSQVGRGTTFRVYFPRAEQANTDAPTQHQDELSQAPADESAGEGGNSSTA